MKAIHLTLAVSLAALPTFGADQWGAMGNRVYNYDTGTNYRKQGNRILGSDGTVITRIQPGVFEKDGVVYRKQGEFVFGSNGVQWRKMGNYWMSNDGRKCQLSKPLADCDEL